MPTRRTTPRMRAGRYAWTGLIAVLGIVAAVTVVWLAIAWLSGYRHETPSPVSTATDSAIAASSDASTSASIEVPALIGMPVEEARVLLATAGLQVELRLGGETLAANAVQVVEGQTPRHGAVVAAGSQVVITARPTASSESTDAARAPRFVVCIDPGHQSVADQSPEPIGPRSKTTKPKMRGGVTGVKTGQEEYEIALQISMNLKRQLEARGVKVVMTRSTNDVNLSNAERAAIASKAKAHLFVRVHGNGSPDDKAAGVSVGYPGENAWTKPIAARSKRAASAMHRAVVASTAAPDRGLRPYLDQSGFNWSRVPAVLVECGFLSNPVEDRLLASPAYQDRLGAGMADGVMEYLKSGESR